MKVFAVRSLHVLICIVEESVTGISGQEVAAFHRCSKGVIIGDIQGEWNSQNDDYPRELEVSEIYHSMLID